MSIALVITDRPSDELAHLLRQMLPDVTIQQWPDITEPETVTLAVLWQHPPGITNNYPNLKAVTSLGAGMDHIIADKAIGDRYQQWRIMTPSLQQRMAQYVLAYVLRDWRNLTAYEQQQQDQKWQVLETDATPTVGFLGLGALGEFVADRCLDLGFKTVAWTRQQKHPKHPCFHGQSGLKKVCQSSDYLVVLVPLNRDTQAIINNKTLSWCQPHTMLINVGRGGHVNEDDLIKSLDKGVIRQAVLDVFVTEPLPDDHAFWRHPKVILSPHISARSDDNQTAAVIVDYYRGLTQMLD
ncbi:NAD(P)-dependent oxidoreductase [Marinicella gelatinilytica]|uniref:NAD(P)-dependent oxidoreductase n=1 Tax=Marinicella gelatinilytica TaxID=2996017 RepID=UPI0022608516|nr:NAD(P)-dependent oxidoreductase [Marinicella gelatinilytica]MCX7545550.1 NAD(P)-binding domain-containing protein [Marinicella gelatinilytica]